MIKLSSLVSAIQAAAQEASKAVAAEQLKILGKYFHGFSNGASLSAGDVLTPIMVRMAFPRETPDGPEQHDVYVPLIVMVPMAALQLTQMEIDLDVQAVIEGEEMLIGTPIGEIQGKEERTNIKIRMRLDVTGMPDGAQIIIEGYSKALRAQIPT